MKKTYIIYFTIAAIVLIFTTMLGIVDNLRNSNESIVGYLDFSFMPYIITGVFAFCFIHMFILFVVGFFLCLRLKNIAFGIFYILSALFFLTFFMGFSNWDRF